MIYAGTPTKPTVLYRTPREGKEFSSALLAKGNLIVVGGRDFFSQLWFSNTSSQYNETTRIHTVRYNYFMMQTVKPAIILSYGSVSIYCQL